MGREHIILERHRVGERWDAFCFQLPNWMMQLPGILMLALILTALHPRGGGGLYRKLCGIDPRARALGSCRDCLAAEACFHRLTRRNPRRVIEAASAVIATGPYQHPAICDHRDLNAPCPELGPGV